MSTCNSTTERKFAAICPAAITSNLTECKPLHVKSNKNQHARGRAGTPGASYDRTTREQEFQEDREARSDRKHLRTNHLTRGQRWVPLLVINIFVNLSFRLAENVMNFACNKRRRSVAIAKVYHQHYGSLCSGK